MYYIIYRLTGRELDPVELARVKGERVFGPEAKLAKEYLLEGGWPKRPPHHALHGNKIWATLPILENSDSPKEGWIQDEDYIWEKDMLTEMAGVLPNLTNPQV